MHENQDPPIGVASDFEQFVTQLRNVRSAAVFRKACNWPNSDDHVRETIPALFRYFVAPSPPLIFGGSTKRFTLRPHTILPEKNEPVFHGHADLAYAVTYVVAYAVAYAVVYLAEIDLWINISKIKRAAHKYPDATAQASLVQTFRYCFHLQNVSIEATVQIAATTSASRWQVLISRVL